jgi:hypothetical protein
LFPFFASGVVDIVDKFTDGVVDTGGNLPLVSVLMLVLVLLIPLVHLDLQISRRIFGKI